MENPSFVDHCPRGFPLVFAHLSWFTLGQFHSQNSIRIHNIIWCGDCNIDNGDPQSHQDYGGWLRNPIWFLGFHPSGGVAFLPPHSNPYFTLQVANLAMVWEHGDLGTWGPGWPGRTFFGFVGGWYTASSHWMEVERGCNIIQYYSTYNWKMVKKWKLYWQYTIFRDSSWQIVNQYLTSE